MPRSAESRKKIRLYTCRWCKSQTREKDEHFLHIKTHLDPKKMLACTICPFVTEYKHHLEYHERNHSGEKPFKCPKCPYQCVNMSMLKSHMKSHSSDYPYECNICDYSVKYKHSLNQHMKKYHQDKALDHIYNEVFRNNKRETSNDAQHTSCSSADTPPMDRQTHSHNTTSGSQAESVVSPAPTSISTCSSLATSPSTPTSVLSSQPTASQTIPAIVQPILPMTYVQKIVSLQPLEQTPQPTVLPQTKNIMVRNPMLYSPPLKIEDQYNCVLDLRIGSKTQMQS